MPAKKPPSKEEKAPTIGYDIPNRANSAVVRCSSCGFEILLVPDVKVMRHAIEAHVEVHRLKAKSSAEAEAESKRVRDDLTKQVLDKAAHLGSFSV